MKKPIMARVVRVFLVSIIFIITLSAAALLGWIYMQDFGQPYIQDHVLAGSKHLYDMKSYTIDNRDELTLKRATAFGDKEVYILTDTSMKKEYILVKTPEGIALCPRMDGILEK